MWVLCVTCLILVLFSPFSVFTHFQTKLVFLQHLCTHSMPIQKADGALWQALVCAQALPSQSPWKSWLQITGLIHLFVVSGSHFIVLQWVLQKLKAPPVFQFFCLWFYNALTGFSAPGTRACLAVTIGPFLKIPSEQKLFTLSLFCLALEPGWSFSLSFWLSWLASLILIITPQTKMDLFRQVIFYTTWAFLGFTMSCWSIPLNLLIGPYISWVLFPLAFLSYVPGIPWLFHLSTEGLQKILEFFAGSQKAPLFSLNISQMVSLVLAMHLFLHLRRLQKQGHPIK